MLFYVLSRNYKKKTLKSTNECAEEIQFKARVRIIPSQLDVQQIISIIKRTAPVEKFMHMPLPGRNNAVYILF